MHHHLHQLIHGLVRKGRLVGIDVVEIAPKYDHNDLTTIAACRLFINAIGAAAAAGHLD
jgi:agmatinase